MSIGMETTVVLAGRRPRRSDCAAPTCAPRHFARVGRDITCARDRFEHIPFDTFLERQNQEFYAAVDREIASRRPGEPCPPRYPEAPARPVPARPEPAEPAGSAPSTSAWPHIGDVAPVPPPDPAPRLRTVYQFLSPVRPAVDLVL